MKSIETAMPTAQVDEILYENGIRYFDDYYNLDNYTEIRCPDGCLYIETKDLTKRIIKKLESEN